MKYLKKFATRAEYEAYMATNEDYPFVGYIADEKKVEYVSPVNYAELPLHFIAEEDLEVSFSSNAIQYSLDNATWQALPAATATPTISKGNKVYFRASGLSPKSDIGIGTFSTTGKCSVAGNIMSLVDTDFVSLTTLQSNHFARLFKDCIGIVDAQKLVLPATALTANCYSLTFMGCINLVNTPKLPATTLATSCYNSMFRDCSSLVNAPELPATALTTYCYSYMFSGCTNLRYIKAMFLTRPVNTYTANWVQNVAATGTFVKNAAATWNVTGVDAIPTGWTVETATE